MTIPGGVSNFFVDSRDYSSSRERLSGGDSPRLGGQTPGVPASDIKSSVLSCNFSDKDKGSRDSNSQLPSSEKMKTNDLKPSLNYLSENDLSDLPFSMPKLQRKMKESGGGDLGLAAVPRAVFPPSGLGLPPPQPPEARPLTRPSLDLGLAPRQSRPVSLHAVSPPSHSHAAISQLKLPLRGNQTSCLMFSSRQRSKYLTNSKIQRFLFIDRKNCMRPKCFSLQVANCKCIYVFHFKVKPLLVAYGKCVTLNAEVLYDA